MKTSRVQTSRVQTSQSSSRRYSSVRSLVHFVGPLRFALLASTCRPSWPLSVNSGFLRSSVAIRSSRGLVRDVSRCESSRRRPLSNVFRHRPASTGPSRTPLLAAPRRLDENADGMLFVNDRCINCAACAAFAPTVFERDNTISKHVVYRQPSATDALELQAARAALAACPVAAIRLENDVPTPSDRQLKEALSVRPAAADGLPFPRPLYPLTSQEGQVNFGTYYLGHHNDASFGAVPYLVIGKSPQGKQVSVMVDTPRFGPSAVRAVKSLAQRGPDYLFLTHVDDTADHAKWKAQFPDMKEIFHSGDLGRHNWIGDLSLENVDVLLQGKSDHDLFVWDIDGNAQSLDQLRDMEEEQFFILHTPGHSPGSISLLFRPKAPPQSSLLSPEGRSLQYPRGIIFTGDTYAWTTRDGGHMSGFPRYGNNLPQQAQTLKRLLEIESQWDIVAPGHGHPRLYLEMNGEKERKRSEMEDALKELI